MFTTLKQFAQQNQTQIKLKQEDLNLGGAPTSVGSNQIEGILLTVYFWAGIVAVIVIIIGGIRYVTSNGSADGVKSAKNTVMYAVIGLVVVIMAAAITGFVINNVGK